MKIKTEVKTEDLDVKELKKIFDESVGGTKAYFISKVQQKYPNLNKKGVESFLNSQEVVQINTKLKGINLKITAKPRTFQIDIMYYKIGQTLKPFLLLIDIMSRKAFCYPISGYKNMTKIITAYKKFLNQVDRVEAIEGDSEFASKEFAVMHGMRRPMRCAGRCAANCLRCNALRAGWLHSRGLFACARSGCIRAVRCAARDAIFSRCAASWFRLQARAVPCF